MISSSRFCHFAQLPFWRNRFSAVDYAVIVPIPHFPQTTPARASLLIWSCGTISFLSNVMATNQLARFLAGIWHSWSLLFAETLFYWFSSFLMATSIYLAQPLLCLQVLLAYVALMSSPQLRMPFPSVPGCLFVIQILPKSHLLSRAFSHNSSPRTLWDHLILSSLQLLTYVYLFPYCLLHCNINSTKLTNFSVISEDAGNFSHSWVNEKINADLYIIKHYLFTKYIFIVLPCLSKRLISYR